MMIDFLESIDQLVVLTINSWNTPFLDELMWIISAKLTWVPLYILILYLFAKKNNLKASILFLLSAIIVVTLTDQISVHLFKNVFERYRPSHHTLLTEQLHFYRFEDGNLYKGGAYGFVSSHAANFFGVMFFAFLVLKEWYKRIGMFLIGVAVIVSFSRIYLGVHYLSDITVGGMLGILIAFLVYKFIFIPIIGREYFKV